MQRSRGFCAEKIEEERRRKRQGRHRDTADLAKYFTCVKKGKATGARQLQEDARLRGWASEKDLGVQK